MAKNYQIGFQSQEQELQGIPLLIEGSVPDWLSGTLIRNCPSKFDFENGRSVNHWFDGLSMLHSFYFQNGKVTYGCRFLQSSAYAKSQIKKKLSSREFDTDPDMDLFDRATAVFQQQFTDNANVNVTEIANRYVALTETPHAIEFELDSLATIGEFKFDNHISGQITTAHPHFDYRENCLFNLLTEIGPSNAYKIYRLQKGSSKRIQIASLPVKEPAYIHSFAITERYVILVEFPLLLNPLSLLFSGKPYIQNYCWQPGKGTCLHVIDKSSGKIVARVACDPCFAFHQVNAFEKEHEILIDTLAYPDASIIDALRLKNLRSNKAILPQATLRRFIVNLDKKEVLTEELSALPLELPRINYRACNGRSYSFVYSAGFSSRDNFLDQLVKVSLVDGSTNIWREDSCYPGEPVFVPTPGANREDDGIILSLVLDSANKHSFLLLLDAQSMHECARLNLPGMVAFGFHGQFFDATSIRRN